MPNKLVDLYRQSLADQGMSDDRSDYHIIREMGETAERENRAIFDIYPDFAQEYRDIREANAPSLGGEVANAFVRGSRGLASTAVGGLALVTGSDYLAKQAHEIEQGGDPARNPTIATMEDIAPGSSTAGKVFSRDALRYGLSQIGGAAPSLAEGVATAAVGAVAGSAFGPEGTIAGAAEGAVEGLLGKGLIKSAIRQLLKKSAEEGAESVAEAMARKGLIKDATQDGIEAAVRAGQSDVLSVVTGEAKQIAARRGLTISSTANSYLLNSGEVYNELNEDPSTNARGLAAGFGLIAALPDTILPAMVARKLFPHVAIEEAKTRARQSVGKIALEALKNTGIEGSTESFQEAVKVVARNISQDKDPLNFTPEDWKQIRESGVGGVAGGLIASGATGINNSRQIDVTDQAAADRAAKISAARKAASVLYTPPPAQEPIREVPMARRVSTMAPEQQAARLSELEQKPNLSQVESEERDLLRVLVPTGEEVETPSTPAVEQIASPEVLYSSPPETVTGEAAQAGPEDANPISEYQYTVQSAQEYEGRPIPGYVQVDRIVDGDSQGSSSLDTLKKEGVDLPTPPPWMPTGKYTVEQVQQAIQQGPPQENSSQKNAISEPVANQPIEVVAADQVPIEKAQSGLPETLVTSGITEQMVQAAAQPTVASKPLPTESTTPIGNQPEPSPLPPTPTEPVKPFAFAPVIEGSSTIDFRSDEQLSQLPAEELLKGIPSLIKGTLSSDGNRSNTRSALVLRAPDGRVVKAGINVAQQLKDVAGTKQRGALTVQRFAAEVRAGGKISKSIKEGGKLPATLNDVIKAGYKPIAYISFDAKPGKIFETFPSEQAFDASWAASPKSTGKQGGMARSAAVGVQAAVDQSMAKTKLQQVEARIDQIVNELANTSKKSPKHEELLNEYRELADRQTQLFHVEQSQTGTEQLPQFREIHDARMSLQARDFKVALARLSRIGAKIDVFAKEMLRQETGNPQAAGVTYSPWHIAVGLEDVMNANMGNLVTLLHEGVHALFGRMAIDTQQKVVTSASKLLSELQTEGRAAAARNGLDFAKSETASEALAETLAQRLAADGIPDAPSIAQAIVRWVKDLYFRTAMALQTALGLQASDKLALDWMENQFRRVMGGDYEWSMISFFDRFVAEDNLSKLQRHEVTGGTPGGVVDFLDPLTMKQSQPEVDSQTLDGLRWNMQFRTAEETDEMPGDEARARIEAAVINKELEIAQQLYTESKTTMPFEAFWKLIGRGDLPQARQAEIAQLLPGAETSTIGDAKMSKAMNEQANVRALERVQKMQAKNVRMAAQLEETVDKESSKLVEQAQEVQVLEQDLRNADLHERTMREKFRDMVKNTVRWNRRGLQLTAASTSLAEAIRVAANITDSEPVPPEFQAFMERLYKGTARAGFEGEDGVDVNLFTYLKEVANLDLDLGSMTIRQIMAAIGEETDNPTLLKLTQNRPLMAAVTALARDQSDQMDMIQLGRMKDTVKYLKIKADLDQIRTASEVTLARLYSDLKDQVQNKGLQQRIKTRYLERRGEFRRTQAKIKKAAEQASMLRDTQTALIPHMEQLESDVGLKSDWTVAEGREWTAMQLQDDGSWVPVKRRVRFATDGTAIDADQTAHDLVMNAQWLEQHKDQEGQAKYARIKKQTYELGMADFKQQYPAHYRNLIDRFLQPLGEEMGALGTAAGARGKMMMLRWQSILRSNWKGSDNIENASHWWTRALKDAVKSAGIPDNDYGVFFQQIYDPVMYMLSTEPGLDEAQAIRKAIRVARARLTTTPTDKFAASIETLVRRTKEINEKLLAIAEKNDVFVEDKKLGGALRRAVSQGWLTNMRHMRADVVQTVTRDMENAGWKLEFVKEERATPDDKQPNPTVSRATTFDSLTSQAAADPAQLSQMLQPLFTPGIIQRWLEPFMNKGGAPIFKWGGKPISMMDVQDAWQQGAGDVVAFMDHLAEKVGVRTEPDEEGLSDIPAFRVSILRQLDQLFGLESKLAYESRQTRQLFDSTGSRGHLLMDARQNDILPPEHIQFAVYDPSSARSVLGLIGFHGAFGRNGERMIQAINELKSNYAVKKAQFGTIQGSSIKHRMADAAARGLDYKDLQKAVRNYQDVEALQQKLERLFSVGNQSGPMGDVRATLEVLGALTGQIVNNPKTGLLNLVSLAERPLTQRSLSTDTVRATGKAYVEFSKNVFGSLLEAMNLHVLRASTFAKEIGEVEGRGFGRLPWEVAMSDIGRQGSFQNTWQDRWLVRPARMLSAFQRKGVSPQFGESRDFARLNAVPGIGGIMNFLSQEAGVANGVANAQQFSMVIKRAVDFFHANPDKLVDPTFRLTAKDLKMNDRAFFGSEGVFDYYRYKATEYRVGNLEEIARDAIRRQATGENLITKEQALAISMMSANELNLESSINTRMGAVSQNPILKYGMPLLGWPLEKMNQVSRAMKTIDGQRDLLTALKTLGRIAAWNLPLGVAFTLWMDKYDEKLLHKKSNMTGVDWQAGVPFIGPAWALMSGKLTAKQNLLGMLERQAKAGNIYGLGGDLAAQIISPQLDPQSGQRTISLDQRVLVMSQFLGVQQALTNFLNQDYTATWASVERPLVQALGGNGALHAVDLVNAALGLDNQESRMVQRTNSTAWLRSAAREVGGIELQRSGVAGSPTPVTVWVREMQLAALANDRLDFQEAYQKALQAARNLGAPDPEKKVLESWRSRDPLEVFKSKPTDYDMARMLLVMDDEGRRAVRESINLYKQYTEMIAPTQMETRMKQMMSQSRPPSIESIRRRASNIFAQ